MTAAVVLIALGSLLLGAILGWLVCSWRAEQRRTALKAEFNEQLAALQKSEKRTNAERKNLAAELAAVRTRLNELTQRTDPADDTQSTKAARLAELEAALAESHERRDSLRASLDNLIERSRQFGKSMAEKDDKIFALSRELESWQQRLPPLVDKYREIDHAHTIALEQLEAERTMNTELSNTMRTRIMPARLADEAACNGDHGASTLLSMDNDTATDTSESFDPSRDDLKRIRGVGPVMERTLNALGIYRLSQIADFGPDDVERISAQLPQFPGRIERDRWVQQARDLLQ